MCRLIALGGVRSGPSNHRGYRACRATEEAEREFDRVHKEGAAPAAAPTVDVKVNGQKEVGIVDLVVSAFAKSKREARQLVAQNGVRVDGAVASEETMVPVTGEPLVQIGKRQAVRVRFR